MTEFNTPVGKFDKGTVFRVNFEVSVDNFPVDWDAVDAEALKEYLRRYTLSLLVEGTYSMADYAKKVMVEGDIHTFSVEPVFEISDNDIENLLGGPTE